MRRALLATTAVVAVAIVLFIMQNHRAAPSVPPAFSFSAGNALQNPGVSGGASQIGQQSGGEPVLVPGVAQQVSVPQVVFPAQGSGGYASASTTVAKTSNAASAPSLLSEVYALLPGATYAPSAAPPSETPEQQALHSYGNEAGQAVAAFETNHADMAQVLEAWFKNRTTGSADAPALRLAADVSGLGNTLASLSDVPPEAAADNAALAQAAQQSGTELKAVIESGKQDDATIAKAMETYDATADAYTKAYAALVELFSAYGVTFASGEPGSAFQFSSSF